MVCGVDNWDESFGGSDRVEPGNPLHLLILVPKHPRALQLVEMCQWESQ